MTPSPTRLWCIAAALMLQSFPVAAAGANASAAQMGAAPSSPRQVRIINETRHAIVRIYASGKDRTDWEHDILGLGTLTAGTSVLLAIDVESGACLVNLKGVFDDGDEVVHNRVNICENKAVRFIEK